MMQWPLLRDVVLFLGGLAGVVHETVLTQAERPTLLILFAAMMGLPAFLRPTGIQGAADKAKEMVEEVVKELPPSESKDGEQES